MVRLKDVQGRIYRFKSESECLKLGILTPVIQDIVRCHMVLVLNVVPAKKDYVKIMTITSTLKDDCEYVPISPTPKKGYAIQIRLRNQLALYGQDAVLHITMLPLFSYLKIDSYDEVPIQMLDEAVDGIGKPLMIWAKNQGGLGQLRDHVRRRDQFRKGKEPCQMIETNSLEKNGV